MEIKEKVIKAYEALAEKYNELIEHKPHNAYYDRPNTLSLLPEVKDKKILDAACGPGKYAEILTAKGATVTGFDISPKMVQLAQERNKNSVDFFVHDMAKSLAMLEDQTYDIVLCALGLDYIEIWHPTFSEFHRVLKPNGTLVISITHPFFDYLLFKAKNYFTTETTQCTWKGFGKVVDVYSYRRSLHECLTPFTNNGFYIENLLEPKPVAEFEQFDARHYKELNAFPSFLCIKGVKKE